MKKITLWLFALFTCWQINAQTGTVVIGVNDGTPNSGTSNPSPLQDYYKTQRIQMLYTAAELSSAGLIAGNITSIGWVATAINTSTLQENYTISMKSTTSTVVTSTFETGATVVYAATDFTPSAIGNINFTLSTPFLWDGTSNIIVEVCAGKASGSFTENVSCANATTTDLKTVYIVSDSAAAPCDALTGTTINQRPLLVIVGNVASCLAPGNVISSAITATTVSISWDAVSPTPGVGYEYFVSTSNVAPTTSGTTTTATSANVSNLLPQTAYNIFVKSKCSVSDNSSWNGPFTFTTSCAPITTFPYAEPFDSFLPNACWFKGDNGDLTAGPATFGNNNWAADGLGNVGTVGAIRYEIWLASANDWVISPQLTIPAAGYELKFDAAATQYGSTNAPTVAWEADDKIEVLVSTNGFTNWTPIFTYNNTNQPATTATPNTIDLSTYAGQTIRIAFRAFEGTANGQADIDFSIDNFLVRLSPACSEPQAIAYSNLTTTSTTISWNQGTSAPANGYQYFVSTSNIAPTGLGTASAVTTANVTTLLPETNYFIFVRSDCGSDIYSPWVGPVSFYTGHCIPSSTDNTTYVNDFSTTGGSINISNLASGYTTGGYLNATAQNVESFPTSSFNFSAAIVGGTAGFSIWVDWNNDLVFNNVTEKVYNTTLYSNGPFSGTIAIPAGTPVGNYKMRITTDYNAANPSNPCGTPALAEFEDYTISVIAPPSCETPISSASAVAGTSATLSWSAVASAVLGYEYVLDNVATNPAGTGIVTTATSYSATSLASNTLYYFHIRSVCSTGTYSTWSSTSFTTTCSSANVPYIQDFESAISPALPNCTSQENVGTGNLWTTDATSGANYGFSTNSLRYSWNSASDANVWFYTQGLNLTGGTAYKISYDYGSTGTTFPERLKVAYGTSASAAAMINAIDDHSSVINSTPINNLVEFTPTTSGVYYFGFNAYSVADNFYLFVDNIIVDVQLANSSFDDANFSFYPNPVKNVLNLAYIQNISQVEVYNLIGQKIISNSFDATTAEIDMSSYTSGVYLVKVTSNNTTKTIRVIKE
ncbi:GEVED domain-containing protein [Flavobacterium sp.]